MRIGLVALGLGAATACVSGEPRWGQDPIHWDPVAASGTHTWHLFAERWQGSGAARHYVCGVVVALEGEPDPSCEACEVAFTVSSRVTDTDCDEGWLTAHPLPVVTALATGEPVEALTSEDPHPGTSRGAMVGYDGDALAPWGWAWPADAPDGGAGWEADVPLTLWPAWIWEAP